MRRGSKSGQARQYQGSHNQTQKGREQQPFEWGHLPRAPLFHQMNANAGSSPVFCRRQAINAPGSSG